MAANGFLVFDESRTNTLTQDEYATDSQRIGGVTSGLARSALHNKALHQVSIMVAALGQLIADKGNDASDEDLLLLTEQLKSIMGGEESFFFGSDGRKYRFGVDEIGLYYEEVESQ